MITVWGEGRGFRVVWLLEEMGLPYALRPVDLLEGAENDPEFMAINPGGFIPALTDGNVTMVESIAIMEYLMARHGPTPLAPAPQDPAFPMYKQFLHLGEAGLAMAAYILVGARKIAPESDRNSWSARQAEEQWETRLRLLRRQLARSPYVAGEAFTAADISVTYALDLARRADVTLAEPELSYAARTSSRDGYKRAMKACTATSASAPKPATAGA
ncbi:MAG TPA: glutathione S-transferase [Phenylobacterium sp.]|nr:glutathione S-transferase [Phenylobacterium sp.]